MQAHDITFPSTIGLHVTGLRAYVAARGWAGVTVTPKLLDKKTARMITVRDDGGEARNTVLPRRHGVNVWAASPVDAENLAIVVADYFRSVARAMSVSGPVDVTDGDDDVLIVGGTTLSHYFVSAVTLVRAADL